MKTISIILLIIILLSKISESADNKYPVSEIPKPLLADAKAVIRKNDFVFEIRSIKQGVVKITKATTILNKNGLANSQFEEAYDKFLSIKKISATIYDRNGKVVRAGLAGDVKDFAMMNGFSLYDEDRVKYLDPAYSNFPFTIEYEYEVDFDGLFYYPSWVLYDDYNVSVENSSLTVIAPEGLKFRYSERNFSSPCAIRKTNGKTSYQWTATSLPARRKELYSASLTDYSPGIYLAPYDFEIDGYKGNCESWENFGKWNYLLGEKRNILNSNTCGQVKALISKADNDLEKMKLLYNYMQNKVRYVSITKGIGGWQPFEASTVDLVSYGDCKALANYMKTLLEIAGIKSYYTLIRAGDNASPLMEDFPSHQFNHAIVCVPYGNDTIWLECTDQRIPFGFLGSFTDDRKCLLISESGGQIARTKVYTGKDNKICRRMEVKLDNYGVVISSICTTYSGLPYDDASIVERLDGEDRQRFIKDRIDLPGCNLLSYNYSLNKAIIPSMTEDIKISVPHYATFNGASLILKPNMLSKIKELPPRSTKRESPIVVRRALCEYDTVEYDLHNNYKLDSGIGQTSFSSPFGEYSTNITLKGNKLIYIRSLLLNKGVFAVDEYDSFVDFYEKIVAEDSRQIILNKL